MSYITEILSSAMGLTDLEEILIKELNVSFLKVYQVISLLGVGAFGVVLEVKNLISRDISALKVKNILLYNICLQIISKKDQ
jgi:hypothetical protein